MRFVLLALAFIPSFYAYTQNTFNAIDGIWPEVESLSFLNNDTSYYNFFSINEYHRSNMALEQKKAFITYLKEKKGLDKLVIELPYAYGYWVNKYLETGDTVLLRTLTDKWWAYDKLSKGLPISHDSYSFFKWLYDYNKAFEYKVGVVGLDLDEVQHAALELWSIEWFILYYSLESHFTNSLQQLVKLVSNSKPPINKVKKWRQELKKDYMGSFDAINASLGADSLVFKNIIIGIDDVIERYGIKEKARRRHRESVLIRNFNRDIKSTDIIYLQFGAGHLFLHNDDLYKYRNFEYLMTSIENTPIYAGKTLNIYVHCADCELGKSRIAYKPYRLKEEGGYTSHPPIDGYADTNLHLKVDNLLNNKSSYIDLRKLNDELKHLSKLYQYLVVLF